MTHLPVSLQSLIIQCLAAVLTGLFFLLLSFWMAYTLPLWQLALAQGTFAAGLSVVCRQPVWWPPLHFGFFPVILLAQHLNISPGVYLTLFLLLVLFYWSTFRTRVPLYLSGRKAWQAVTSLLPEDRSFRFIDVGSGLGGVPFYLESRFPQGQFFGTEIAPAPWLISRVRAWVKRSRVVFMRRDYAALDLGEFDVVFAFLSPAAMPDLWEQAQVQMRSGSLFISLSFSVKARKPDQVLSLAEGPRHTLYVWKM